MSANVFLGGVPTQPDVDKLQVEFKIPTEGTLIGWDAMARVIGVPVKSHRFRTVVHAWRKWLYVKHNVFLGAEPGKGLVALPPDGRIEAAKAKVSSGAKIIKRGVGISCTTDRSRLTPENAKAADHFARLGANIRLAEAASARGIELPALDVKG